MAYVRNSIYHAIKYINEGPNDWAVFLHKDVKGMRSPISEYTKAVPLTTNCSGPNAKAFIKDQEERDKNEG